MIRIWSEVKSYIVTNREGFYVFPAEEFAGALWHYNVLSQRPDMPCTFLMCFTGGDYDSAHWAILDIAVTEV